VATDEHNEAVEAAERALVEASGWQLDDPHYGCPSPYWRKLTDAAIGAYNAALQPRSSEPWTGRTLFEFFEHEAERGRGWTRLSARGRHRWVSLAGRIEREIGQPSTQPLPERAERDEQ
jgi:hypothetical protein